MFLFDLNIGIPQMKINNIISINSLHADCERLRRMKAKGNESSTWQARLLNGMNAKTQQTGITRKKLDGKFTRRLRSFHD